MEKSKAGSLFHAFSVLINSPLNTWNSHTIIVYFRYFAPYRILLSRSLLPTITLRFVLRNSFEVSKDIHSKGRFRVFSDSGKDSSAVFCVEPHPLIFQPHAWSIFQLRLHWPNIIPPFHTPWCNRCWLQVRMEKQYERNTNEQINTGNMAGHASERHRKTNKRKIFIHSNAFSFLTKIFNHTCSGMWFFGL